MLRAPETTHDAQNGIRMSDVIAPEGWPRPRGYSDGIAAEGRFLAIAGQIGWNGEHHILSDDFLDQAAQALRNVLAIVHAANGTRENIVRLTWYITNKNEYTAVAKPLGAIFKELFGRHYPAMTLVQVAALLEPRAKVEIEATAIL